MTPSSRLTRSLRGMRITTRLALGIGLLLGLMAIIAIAGGLSILMARDAERSIRKSAEIHRLVLEMDRGMEKARRLHGDFFLQYPRIGLAAAHETYAQPSVRQISRVIALSRNLKELLDETAVGSVPGDRRVDLNLYLSFAQRFAETSIRSVELVTELAAPERGLEAQLETHFERLQAQVGEVEHLAHLLAEMRSFAQSYRISRERFLMQSAFNAAFRLRKALNRETDLSGNRKARIRQRLDQFTVTAEKILAIDVAIKSKFNDFALQAAAVDPVSATLTAMAEEAVRKAQGRIDRAHAMAIAVTAAVTLAGLIIGVIIARLLTASITRRVVDLTRTAEELRKGNLDVFSREEGNDELSQLARTFNVMAARIRELVEDLEGKVARRTAELSASDKRFRQLFEQSGSGVAIYEPVEDGADFVFRDVNQAVERIEGINREALIGNKVTEVFPGIHQFGLLAVFRRVWETGEPAYHPLCLYSDHRLSGWRENRVYRLPTGEVVAVYDDLTAQKQAETEKKAMETRLQRAQKMEAIGLLAGGVAHDLNNILSGIVGYPELLLMQIDAESPLRSPLKAIKESGERAAAVVSDLLTVARGVVSVKNTADLNDLVEEYLHSPEHRRLGSHYPRVGFETRLHHGLEPIACSPIHVRKCIMNLVTNAVEAIDGAGSVRIATCHRSVDEKMARENGIQAGRYVVLTVADDGKGIAAKDLEHIFEPFYTKKAMGFSGTGLGLAVVWNSMADHDGTVLVDSGAEGSAFHLYFPVSKSASAGPGERPRFDDLRGRGEKILVVDDEPHLLEVTGGMLTALGYETTCLGSGEAAVDYLTENRADLVVLDMIMEPGINGRQTYERILRIHPEQKAVIASGFSESEEVIRARRLGATGFIKKPFTLEELGLAVKTALRE